MHVTRFSALLAIVLTASALSAASFTRTNYSTGNGAVDVVSIDLDRDGHPDLVTADSAGFLTVLMGNGGGKFTISANFATQQKPIAMVVGDFNNDGFPDVVVLETQVYEVFLSAHNGALVSQGITDLSPGDVFGQSIVAVDLNGDHIPDLAFTFCDSSSGNCKLVTALNNGTGKFTAGGETMALGPTGRNSLVAADFDRDSHDDLAVASGTSVLILHSNNNGLLSPLQTITNANSSGVGTLAAGDIDVKNGPDLVFTVSPSCSPTDCVEPSPAHVYLNNGSGKLVANAVYTTEIGLIKLKFGDITGDNRLDLLAVDEAFQDTDGDIAWAHYTGSGKFAAFAVLEPVVANPQGLAIRDLNLDSSRDMAVANQLPDGPPGTIVFLNTTSGSAICTPPSSANLAAKLCSPTSNPSSGTFTVKAAGNSPTGVRRVELWVDGTKRYNSPDDRLLTTVTLSKGTHKLEIVAVDQFGATAKTSRSVSVP